MNRGALLDELGRRLVELHGAEGMYDPTERVFALNWGQLQMARKLKLLRATAVRDATINVATYSLTAGLGAGGFAIAAFLDLIDPGLVYDDGVADVPLVRRSLEWLYAHRSSWRRDAAGTPALFFPAEGGEVFRDLVQIHPKPAATVVNGLRLHHLLRPADMTDDTHEPWNTVAAATRQFPSLVPFDDALVWYAVARLFGDEDEEKAKKAMAFYRAMVGEATGHVFIPDRVDAMPVKTTRAYARRRG